MNQTEGALRLGSLAMILDMRLGCFCSVMRCVLMMAVS
jgi:hypothetical protein